ncbi:MAG: hypothetical protein JXA25_00620 [Anaerolineales bacterium]|nr:hypothetical protein [Anaerolineales bacterium]
MEHLPFDFWDSIKQLLLKVKNIFNRPISETLSLPLFLYIAGLVVFFPAFFPNLSDINPFDEAAYLYNGYRLLESGVSGSLSGNPFTRLFYALMALPFRNSVFWMIHACSLGRFFLFTLMWVAMYKLGLALSDRIIPLVLPILLIMSPLFPDFLRFPSDPLYAGFATLALARSLSFIRFSRLSDLWWASALLGFAALSRNDGLLLFLVFFCLILLWSVLKGKLKLTLLPAILPFLILVGGYILAYGLFTGDFSPGTMRRTYDNFETGYGVIIQNDTGLADTPAAKLSAREAYGTPEENNYSVFTAIHKRPDLFLARLKIVLADMPRAILDAYGLRVTAVLMLLAAWGGFSLVRARDWERLFLLLLWPSPFISGFVISIFRTGHLQFYACVLFALAAIGLFSILQSWQSIRNRWILLSALSLITLYGFSDNKLAVAYGGYIFLMAFVLIMLYISVNRQTFNIESLLILLTALLITRASFPTPNIRTLGEEPEEQILLYINQEMKDVQTFAAASQGVIHAARKDCAMLTSEDVPTNNTPEEFLEWLQVQGIEAVYIDKFLTSRNSAMWEQIQPLLNSGLTRVFDTDQGSYQILLVEHP